eukprot:2781538-Prymnesium_polylepis.2
MQRPLQIGGHVALVERDKVCRLVRGQQHVLEARSAVEEHQVVVDRRSAADQGEDGELSAEFGSHHRAEEGRRQQHEVRRLWVSSVP